MRAGLAFEEVAEGSAVHVVGDAQTRVVEEGGGEVQVGRWQVMGYALLYTGSRYNEGHAGRGVQGFALAPGVVVAEHFTVIRGKDDKGIVQFAPFFEQVQVETDLMVDVFDHGRVVSARFEEFIGRELVVAVRLWESDVFVEFSHAFRDVQGQVGPVEIDLYEPGVVPGDRLDEVPAILPDPVVAIGVIGQWRGKGTALAFAVGKVVEVHLAQAAFFEELQIGSLRFFASAIGAVYFAFVVDAVRESPFVQMAFAVQPPGWQVGCAGAFVEVEFATSQCVVPAVAEHAVNSGPVYGIVVAISFDGTVVVFCAGCNTGATGRAYRCGADGFGECRPVFLQAVQVGRAYGNVGIAADPIKAKLVGKKEEDVGAVR